MTSQVDDVEIFVKEHQHDITAINELPPKIYEYHNTRTKVREPSTIAITSIKIGTSAPTDDRDDRCDTCNKCDPSQPGWARLSGIMLCTSYRQMKICTIVLRHGYSDLWTPIRTQLFFHFTN